MSEEKNNNELVYKIKGIDYLLVQMIFAKSKSCEKMTKVAEKHCCIIQSVDIRRRGWLENDLIVIRLLIPVDSIDLFYKDL